MNATANDIGDCHCERYRQFVDLQGLGGDVGDALARSINPEGRQLVSKLRLDNSGLIPTECRSRLLKDLPRARVTAIVRGIYDVKSFSFESDQNTARDLVSMHTNIYAAAFSSCDPRSTDYSACLKANASRDFAGYSRNYEGSPASVQAFLASQGYSVTTSQAKVLKAYNQVFLNALSEDQLLKAIASKRDGLDNDEFVQLVVMAGARMRMDYDFSRRAGWTSLVGGAVSGQAIQRAARNNESVGYAGGTPGANADAVQYAGVCRDIASFQGRMLEARGFPNTVLVSFEESTGPMHTTLVTQDPTTPRKVYQINYGALSRRTDVDGAQALFQGPYDATLNYRLFRPDGAMIAAVPSELQKFLTEATGFDIHHLDEGARATSSLAAVNVELGRSGRTQLHAVAGHDGIGDTIAGVSVDTRWGDNSIAPGRVGLFVGDVYRPARSYGTPKSSNILMTYLQAEQHLKTAPLPLTHGLTLTLDNWIGIQGALGVMADDPWGGSAAGKLNGQGNAQLTSEVRLNQTAANSAVKATYRAGFTTMPGLADARNLRSVNLDFTQAYLEAMGSVQTKHVRVTGDALVVADQLGARARLEVGVDNGKVGARASYTGRLTDGTALWQDGSIRRVGLKLTYQPLKRLRLGVSGEVPVEGDIAHAQIMGMAELTD